MFAPQAFLPEAVGEQPLALGSNVRPRYGLSAKVWVNMEGELWLSHEVDNR